MQDLVLEFVFPMLEPLGFQSGLCSEDQVDLKRLRPEGQDRISFHRDSTHRRVRFAVGLHHQEHSMHHQEHSIELAALVGKKDGWWYLDEDTDRKHLSETLLVGILNAGLGWLEC